MGETSIGSFGDLLRCENNMCARIDIEYAPEIVNADTWESVVKISNELCKPGEMLYGIAFDKEKTIYAVCTNRAEKAIVIAKQYFDASLGETVVLKSFGGQMLEDGNAHILKLMVDDSYFYLQSQTEAGDDMLQIFTHDGKLYSQYEDIADFDIDGNGALYISKLSSKTMHKYDMAAMEKIYSVAVNSSDGSAVYHIALEKDSNILYAFTKTSVQIYNAQDEKYIKSVLEFAETAPNLTKNVQRMVVDENHSIYFMLYDGAGQKLFFFKYDIAEDPRRDMPYTLTITAPYRDDFIALAIARFEKDNVNQKVKYDYTYNSRNDFFNSSDSDGYFEKANIRLMSGDVGDIVMTGGEWNDIYQRFTMDIFFDLKQDLEKEPLYNALDKKLLDGISVDGKIKGLPLAGEHFLAQINLTLCREMGIELDWNNATWSDILALNKRFEGTDKYLFSMYGDSERAFIRLIISNMPDMIDRETKKVNLRQQWFLDLLEQWKKAIKSPNFAKLNKTVGLTEDALICVDWKTGEMPKEMLLFSLIGFQQESGKDMRIYPLFSGEKHSNRTASSEETYSIMEGSKNKENAWKFLSTALHEDLQNQVSMQNIPININARAEKVKDIVEQAVSYFQYRGSDQAGTAEKYVNDMENVYNSVDYLYDMNKIKEDLFRPLLKYLDGTSTLDEALKTAEHDIWIRLNE